MTLWNDIVEVLRKRRLRGMEARIQAHERTRIAWRRKQHALQCEKEDLLGQERSAPPRCLLPDTGPNRGPNPDLTLARLKQQS